MTSKKTTRRALLSSAIALLLCVSMLVGSTFAWFTDEVTSANNIIKSGTLDVEVYNGLDNTGTELEKVEKLFSKVDLWEPGVVSYENLTVANLGTLALKYTMNVNFTNENTVNGYGLSQILKVAVVEGGVQDGLTREQLIASVPAADWKAMTDFVLDGKLYPVGNAEGNADQATVGLVIYWEPTAEDNNWNVNNSKETSDKADHLHIDLGINLFATQQMAESDSFGPDYDEDAVATSVVVTSEEELVEALAEAKNGAVIGIKGKVTWTTGAGIGSTPFETEAKNITLLGMDESSTFTAIGNGVGEIGIDNGTVTFKNLKIVDESVSYAESSWEYGYLEFRGNTVFENCNVVNAIMMEGDSAKFVNCTFNSHDDNQYAVWVSNGSATFTGCTFTGARGLKTHEAYGSEVVSVVVDDCYFGPLSKKPGVAIGTMNAETAITIKNSTFAGTQAGDQGNYIYETDTDVTTFSFTEKDNLVLDTVSTADALIEALENGKDVTLTADVEINPANQSNGYGKTGINVKNCQTIDGNGNTLDVKGAGGTWDSGISTTGGVIKNITVTGAFRGIFVNHNSTYSEKVVLENVIIDGPVYTISCDQGSNQGLEATKCTFNGWTSYAATIGNVKFVDCSFGEGSGYAFCRPYAPTEFVNCDFEEGFTVDPRAAVTFENCYLNGVLITAENVTELVTSVANVTVK